MTVTVDLRDAQADLSATIERVRPGEEIVIALAGVPVVQLVREPSREPRQPGRAKGMFVIHENFHDPLPDDLLDLFEGKGDKLLDC
jgi:antitoxin (DNA-binding transcriptional repressor) of toxin-antitoxin stability system